MEPQRQLPAEADYFTMNPILMQDGKTKFDTYSSDRDYF